MGSPGLLVQAVMRAANGPRLSVLLAAGSTLALVAGLAWWHSSALAGALVMPQQIGASCRWGAETRTPAPAHGLQVAKVGPAR